MAAKPDSPEEHPAVLAMSAARESFVGFWDKLMSVSEIDVDFSVIMMYVKLSKAMFEGFPSTYTDEETGWTYPSDIAEAVQLLVVGSDIVGDGASFGLLLNEIEMMLRDRPVTTEFQKIEGGTYGELLRMIAIRFLLEFHKNDLEIMTLQSERLQLANDANDAAGLTGPPPPRKQVSKQYQRTWDQLKRYWLNEEQFQSLFQSG